MCLFTLYNSHFQSGALDISAIRRPSLESEPPICFCCVVLSITQLSSAQSAKASDTAQFSGYTAQSSKPEREWENKFRDGIVRDNVRENMRRMSARPHHVGS